MLSYVETLKAEIGILKRHLAPGVRLRRLHWGGGTPTLLQPKLIHDLSKAIFAATPLAEGGEFSVEIDPNEIDAPRLDALADAGMNRASIGVQDFGAAIQKAIGREQSFELTRDVADMIRQRDVRSLNADILFGLPHQDQASITDSVRKLLSLAPDRVALYGYAHVPWMSRRQQMIPLDATPSPQQRLGLFEAARQLFLGDGYQEIGIDHFARPDDALALAATAGRLRRNFQGYTDDSATTLVGLGASAISRFPQGYAQNASATSEHVAAIRNGAFSTRRGHAFASDDLLRGRIIEALMCDFRVSRVEMQQYGTADVTTLFANVAADFPGMVRCDDFGLAVLPEARPLTRMIARGFDAYDQGKGRHSAAI